MFLFERTKSPAFLMLALLLGAAPVLSADLRGLTVELEDGHYLLTSESWLDASVEEIYRVLTDYELFVEISSGYVESHNTAAAKDGKPGFYTRMQGCVLVWCKSFERSGHLTLRPMSNIVALVDPEVSDFDYSRESWELIAEDGGTVMIYHFEMDPGFWVPPVIGPFYIKRTLVRAGEDAIERIEALAQGRDPGD